MRAPNKLAHRSIDYKRLDFNHREHAFATLWEQENERRSWLNFGHGILQDLMAVRIGYGTKWRHIINNRDAAIVATVVQWLGSNVGMSFVEAALKKCGYLVIQDPKWLVAGDLCPTCHGRGRRGVIAGIAVCGWCKRPTSRKPIVLSESQDA